MLWWRTEKPRCFGSGGLKAGATKQFIDGPEPLWLVLFNYRGPKGDPSGARGDQKAIFIPEEWLGTLGLQLPKELGKTTEASASDVKVKVESGYIAMMVANIKPTSIAHIHCQCGGWGEPQRRRRCCWWPPSASAPSPIAAWRRRTERDAAVSAPSFFPHQLRPRVGAAASPPPQPRARLCSPLGKCQRQRQRWGRRSAGCDTHWPRWVPFP